MKLKTLLEAIKDCDSEASVVYNGEGIFIVDGRKVIQIRDLDNNEDCKILVIAIK